MDAATLKDIVIVALVVSGSFFFAVGTIGLLRMPGVLPRIHATTKCDTLGGGLMMVALAIHAGFNVVALRVLMILLFLWLSGPTASHLLARAVYRREMIDQTAARQKAEG